MRQDPLLPALESSELQIITHRYGHTSHRSSPARLKVPYGLRDGRMWTVRDVPSGIACACLCPACGHRLVAKAKNSKSRKPHFAHYKDAECQAGFESSIHRMAKQLILDQLAITLPAWDGEREMPNPPVLIDDSGMILHGKSVQWPAQRKSLFNVRLEESQGDYIPDVIAEDDEGIILIEIRVTHAVDEIKRRRIQSEGLRLIEIDLSRIQSEQAMDLHNFEHEVLWNVVNRKWLSCPPISETWRESLRGLKLSLMVRNKEIAERRQLAEEARNRKDQEWLAARSANPVKAAIREEYRLQLRIGYQTELATLIKLTSHENRQYRMNYFLDRDSDAISTLMGSIQNEVVRELLLRHHPDAWIYEAHPLLWQAEVYNYFIASQKTGERFNQRDVARWVRQRHGFEESLYKLFRAQYQARASARKIGYDKNRITAWYFSNAENSLIPNFYHPINWLIGKFSELGLLDFVPNVPGEVVIS